MDCHQGERKMSYYADRVSPEIAASQAEYAARKWATFVCTRYFSGTSRFVTFREAVAYAVQIKTLAESKGESRDFWAELSGPGGKFAQNDVAPLLT
jgi:hypothetical protein